MKIKRWGEIVIQFVKATVVVLVGLSLYPNLYAADNDKPIMTLDEVKQLIEETGANWLNPNNVYDAVNGVESKDPLPSQGTYQQKQILNYRYGTADFQKYLQRAYQFADEVGQDIAGQRIAAEVLEDHLVRYLEGFPNRTGEPVYLNLVGFPGVGKSAMLTVLENLGIKTVRLEAQKYISEGNLGEDLGEVRTAVREGVPVILVIDEIDKVSEIQAKGDTDVELTRRFIGALNQILAEGIAKNYGTTFSVSNVFVLTTMNFAPNEIEDFSQEVLGERKEFFDFTMEDFKKFDEWIRDQASATYKILAKLFRDNTVTRIAPNTIVMEHFSQEVYRTISKIVINRAIRDMTSEQNEGKQIAVTADDSFVEFIRNKTSFSPSGAREVVFRGKAMTEQLISFGIRFDNGQRNLARPRLLHLESHDEDTATVVVTPLIKRKGGYSEGKPSKFTVSYDQRVKMFLPPPGLAKKKPKLPAKKVQPHERPVTKKEIRAARFPIKDSSLSAAAAAINQELFGQKDAIKESLDEVGRFLSQLNGEPPKVPFYKVISGFPGIGKSDLVELIGRELDLPIIKINLQTMESGDDAVKIFYDTLATQIRKVEVEDATRPYIILLEELDKISEFDSNGDPVPRPVVAVIKELLNSGKTSIRLGADGGYTREIDIRRAFTFVTMNFDVDRFGFSADPRITTVEDVHEAWLKLSRHKTNVKKLLGSMFRPEMVNRILARFTVMRPLSAYAYRQIVKKQIRQTVERRLTGQDGRNVSAVSVETTARYRKYLYDENVIPSEGARYTAIASSDQVAADLNFAMRNLPKDSKYETNPVTVTLDYRPNPPRVVIHINRSDIEDEPVEIGSREVVLAHPSLKAKGKVSQFRMHVTAHEVGHAMALMFMGGRFESIVVAPPSEDVGGFVKFKGKAMMGHEMVARLYAGLGSRAMERVIWSKEPLNPDSVLSISKGPSQDISGVSAELYNLLFELGFYPGGGTHSRTVPYANYEAIPAQQVTALGLILRDMENFLVEEFLRAHTQEWYVEKIGAMAKKGYLSEQGFYKLVGYTHPGPGKESFGGNNRLEEIFKNAVEGSSSQAKKAAKTSAGPRTVEENVEVYMDFFLKSVKNRLPTAKPVKSGSKGCGGKLASVTGWSA